MNLFVPYPGDPILDGYYEPPQSHKTPVEVGDLGNPHIDLDVDSELKNSTKVTPEINDEPVAVIE